MQKLRIKSSKRQEIIDITPLVEDYLSQNRYTSGIVVVFSPHTTAAISVNENADPDVKKDINYFLNNLVPQDLPFAHTEGNADAHIKGSLINFSQTFIVEKGRIQLGTWQGIFFMEFDGPRNRELWLKYIPEQSIAIQKT